VIFGDKDLVRPEHGMKVHELIKGSQLCILPNATHFVLDENPELVGRMVVEFLNRKKIAGYEHSY